MRQFCVKPSIQSSRHCSKVRLLDSAVWGLLQTTVSSATLHSENNSHSALGLRRLAVGLAGCLLTCSCDNQSQIGNRSGTPQAEQGRYQIVSAAEPSRGTVLFLIDTKEGTTWIYRGPQGNAFNGFWSNIPKLQVSDEYWREAMRALVAAPATNNVPSPAEATLPTNAPPVMK